MVRRLSLCVRRRLILVGVTISATLFCAPGYCAQADSADQLSRLRHEIKEIEQSLATAKSEQDSASQRLRLTEKRIGKLSTVVDTVNRKINQQSRQIADLKQKTLRLNTKLQQHRSQLSQQIRTAHALGQQEYLKILLTAENPAAISRTLTYYDYLNRQKASHIEHTNATLREVTQLQDKLKQQEKALLSTRRQYEMDLKALVSSRASRMQLIASLDNQIVNKQQRLQKLHQDEDNLTELLRNLVNKPKIHPITPKQIEPKQQVPFRQLKGKLTRPVPGKIIRSFGQRQLGELRSKGILFAASEDQPIRAVAPGQVIFADWIRGFGMMIIIDHGELFMSLYGHNTSLHKETGDWVDSNDIIASAGASGGLVKNGLYFELRHNGKPVDPARWLKKTGN